MLLTGLQQEFEQEYRVGKQYCSRLIRSMLITLAQY
jgi:hypothetical protein